jgi:RpiB/LacA/LacB family sugar-phosphate isomerase
MKKQQLITDREVRLAAQQGQSVLRIHPKAIITPLALDSSQSLGVRFEFIKEDEKRNAGLHVALAITVQAFPVKRAIVDILRTRNITITDIPDVREDDVKAAVEVVKRLVGSGSGFGIIADATGIRSAMIANRFEGIRAFNAHQPSQAQIARKRYNANLVTLGSDFLKPRRAAEIVAAFIDSKYIGDSPSV